VDIDVSEERIGFIFRVEGILVTIDRVAWSHDEVNNSRHELRAGRWMFGPKKLM
jgi:hypothetical protein